MEEVELAKDIGTISAMVFTIVQSLKMAGIPSKYSPIIAIVVGVSLGFLFDLNPIFGLMGGLSASGLYSGVKKGAEDLKEDIYT